MAVEKKLIDKETLKTLVPCDALSEENLNVLAGKSYIEKLHAGDFLFKAGQYDSLRYYLISGDILLELPGQAPKLLRAETKGPHHAIGHNQPRQATVIAKTEAVVALVDEELLVSGHEELDRHHADVAEGRGDVCRELFSLGQTWVH